MLSKISKPHQHKIHLISIIVIFAVATLVVFELSPIGGNVRFYTNWLQCGRKPVASGLSSDNAKYYYEPSSWPGTHPTLEYFCTPLKAELAGYSANPSSYEFPYINAQ